MKNPNLKGSREERRLLSRQAIESHLLGFLRSISEPCVLHFVFTQTRSCPGNFAHLARGQTLVFAVRSLETLMRDCLLTCAQADEDFRKRLIEKYWRLTDVEFDSNNGMHYEILLSSVSAQNLEAMERNFGIFFDAPLFERISHQAPQVIFKLDDSDKLYPSAITFEEFNGSYREGIFELFQYRHEVVHNGHFNLHMPYAQLEYFLELVLLFGQSLCLIIGDHLKNKGIIASNDSHAGQAAFSLRFSEYAKILAKISPPSNIEREELVEKMIRDHEIRESGKEYPPAPKNRMGLAPFFFSLRDILRLNLSEGNKDGFDPLNVIHLFYISESGHIENSTLRRR